MIKELILFSEERWQYWLSLVNRVYLKKYDAASGSKDEAFYERRKLISVAHSEYEGYIELISMPL